MRQAQALAARTKQTGMRAAPIRAARPPWALPEVPATPAQGAARTLVARTLAASASRARRAVQAPRRARRLAMSAAALAAAAVQVPWAPAVFLEAPAMSTVPAVAPPAVRPAEAWAVHPAVSLAVPWAVAQPSAPPMPWTAASAEDQRVIPVLVLRAAVGGGIRPGVSPVLVLHAGLPGAASPGEGLAQANPALVLRAALPAGTRSQAKPAPAASNKALRTSPAARLWAVPPVAVRPAHPAPATALWGIRLLVSAVLVLRAAVGGGIRSRVSAVLVLRGGLRGGIRLLVGPVLVPGTALPAGTRLGATLVQAVRREPAAALAGARPRDPGSATWQVALVTSSWAAGSPAVSPWSMALPAAVLAVPLMVPLPLRRAKGWGFGRQGSGRRTRLRRRARRCRQVRRALLLVPRLIATSLRQSRRRAAAVGCVGPTCP